MQQLVQDQDNQEELMDIFYKEKNQNSMLKKSIKEESDKYLNKYKILIFREMMME